MAEGKKNNSTIYIVIGLGVLAVIAYFMFFGKKNTEVREISNAPVEDLGYTQKGEKITEAMVQAGIRNIRTIPEWFAKVKQGAWDNAHTLEQELRLASIYWLQNK